MKKIITLVSLAMLFTSVKSQVAFGLHVDGLVGGGKFETRFGKLKSEPLLGGKFGLMGQIQISEKLKFIPEFNIVGKGFNLNETNTAGVDLFFLEVPLNIAYNFALGKGDLFAGIGPVVSFGLGGKLNDPSFSADVKFDGEENANDGNLHLKKLEIGGNIFAGYKLSNGFFGRAGFNSGINNLSPDAGTTFKTNYFSLGVGFIFNHRK